MVRLLLCLLLLVSGTARAETVVFLEGLGGGPHAYDAVIAGLRGDVSIYFKPRPKVIAGDEDGLRSPRDVARDLHARLGQTKLDPPFIMVGHSLGGAHALAFARLYPDEVKGLLLIDPRLPSYTPACRARGQSTCDLPKAVLALMPDYQKREYYGLAVDERFLGDMAALGDLPVTILGAARPQIGLSPEWQAFWLEQLQAVAKAAPNGRFLSVPDSGHMIQKQRPDLVLDEIRRLLN